MRNKKTILKVLVLSSFFVMNSCNNTNSTDTSNEESQPEDSSVVNQDNTIGDAYDDSRPDYDSMFDYDSDYTPQPPDSEVTPIIVTLPNDSIITFANGSRSKEVDPNSSFKEEDFDFSKVEEGRHLEGFALYTTEDGDFKGTFALSDLKAPKKDITIKPYFAAKDGYTSLDIGSGSSSKFNYDQVPGSITENKTIKYASDVLVDGGKNGYTEKGVSFTETSYVDINSAMRLDTKASIDEEAIYEFTYNFANLGSTTIYLDGYQISASAEYKGKYDYESRYRMDIDLEPGESKSFTAQYKLGKNSNALTYFVADRTMQNGFALGMSMAFKKTTLTEIDSKYISEPEKATTGKVKLQLPDGITVDGFEEDQVAGKPITVPSDDQISNTTGREIDGWYIVDDPIKAITSSTVVSDIKEYTIAPYFASNYGETLQAGTNSKGNLPDYAGHTLEDGTLDDGDDAEMVFKAKDTIVDGLIAKNFSSSYKFSKGDYFRILTGTTISSNIKYKFHYVLKNNSSKDISLTTYQVLGGKKISPEEGASSYQSVIAANSSVEFDLEIKSESANSNAITIFVFDEAADGLDLDIALAKDKVQEAVKSTLTIVGGSGVCFEDGSTSVSLEAGAKMPAIKNDTGRTLLGFYDDENKYTSDTFEMPGNDIELRPYFDVRDGYTRLYAMSGKSGGLPNNVSGSISSSSFEGTNSSTGNANVKEEYKTIVKGDTGLDEEGLIFKTKSDVSLAKNDAFRFDCVASSSAVVTLNKEHSYCFNFENRGENEISFDVTAVNSGTNKASGTNNTFELTLAAGAYKSVEINPTFVSGSANKNVLIYFEAKEDMATLNMAVSMSAKFNS